MGTIVDLVSQSDFLIIIRGVLPVQSFLHSPFKSRCLSHLSLNAVSVEHKFRLALSYTSEQFLLDLNVHVLPLEDDLSMLGPRLETNEAYIIIRCQFSVELGKFFEGKVTIENTLILSVNDHHNASLQDVVLAQMLVNVMSFLPEHIIHHRVGLELGTLQPLSPLNLLKLLLLVDNHADGFKTGKSDLIARDVARDSKRLRVLLQSDVIMTAIVQEQTLQIVVHLKQRLIVSQP